MVTLSPSVKVVSTTHTPPLEKTIQGNIPVHYLRSYAPLWHRLGQKIYWGVQGKRLGSVAIGLRLLVKKYEIDAILVHYLGTVARFQHLWGEVDLPIYAHCHGFDVTWDLRHSDPPHPPVHSESYQSCLMGLPDNFTFIANSRYSAKRLREIGIPPRRIIVKYIGVPVSPVFPERESFEGGRKLSILYLGRLIDCKGPDKVIQAFELASKKGLNGELVVAGDGPLRGICETLRNRSPFRERIKILGIVDAETGKRLRKNADIFTAHNCKGPQTNQEEALGVSILEAMADGLPVVAGSSGGVLETVVDGETGFLVPPGDVERHADALLQLSHDEELRKKMGYRGWLRVKENFSEEKERLEFQRIFQN